DRSAVRIRSGSLYNLCWPDHVKLVYRVERLGCPVSLASAMLEQLGQYCSCTKPERRTEMGRIVVSDNVSLDGVIQDPAGDEGFRVGGWVGRIMDRKELAKVTLDEALGTEALLLGRRSYEWFAARWPSRSGELADRLNSLPKYVVSATLEHPAWNNSTVLKGDVLNEVSTLKQHIDGDIVIAGSFQLARTLIEHDLVDELRLKIFPVALGVGERLFGETSDKKPMRLLDTQTLEGGIAYLTYQSAREPSGVRRR